MSYKQPPAIRIALYNCSLHLGSNAVCGYLFFLPTPYFAFASMPLPAGISADDFVASSYTVEFWLRIRANMQPWGYTTTAASNRSGQLGDREVYILPFANPLLVNPICTVSGDQCLGPLRQYDINCDRFGADFLQYALAARMDYIESHRYYIGYSARELTICGQYCALDLYVQHPGEVFGSHVYQHYAITDALDPATWYRATNLKLLGMRAFPPDGPPMYLSGIPRPRF